LKLDCHTHTSRFSACSVISPDDLLKLARERDLDGLVLTEHNRFWPPDEVSWLRRAFPELLVFTGAEITVGPHHVVVFLPRPDTSLFLCGSLESLSSAVAERDGYAFVAHPFRFNPNFDELVRNYPFAAIEVASFNQPQSDRVELSLEYARRHDLQPITASDAHSSDPVGDYFIKLPEAVVSVDELIAALHAGDFDLHAPVLPGNNNKFPDRDIF